MKVVIAGSRSITDYNIVKQAIEESGFNITEVVSGTANGVDKLGEKYAIENNIPIKRFPADWNRHGKSAGYKRNEEMAIYCDAVIAIWDGISNGTRHMINLAAKHNKPVFIGKLTDASS